MNQLINLSTTSERLTSNKSTNDKVKKKKRHITIEMELMSNSAHSQTFWTYLVFLFIELFLAKGKINFKPIIETLTVAVNGFISLQTESWEHILAARTLHK